MIQRSISLEQRLERETVRHAGSLAVVVFYDGEMPPRCELQATGNCVIRFAAAEGQVREMTQGIRPPMPKGATYWRLLDNNGNVVMQGDGT